MLLCLLDAFLGPLISTQKQSPFSSPRKAEAMKTNTPFWIRECWIYHTTANLDCCFFQSAVCEKLSIFMLKKRRLSSCRTQTRECYHVNRTFLNDKPPFWRKAITEIHILSTFFPKVYSSNLSFQLPLFFSLFHWKQAILGLMMIFSNQNLITAFSIYFFLCGFYGVFWRMSRLWCGGGGLRLYLCSSIYNTTTTSQARDIKNIKPSKVMIKRVQITQDNMYYI